MCSENVLREDNLPQASEWCSLIAQINEFTLDPDGRATGNPNPIV